METRNYVIQCKDSRSGQVADFTFDEAAADRDGYFTATSPLFGSLDALFDWARIADVDLRCRFYNFPKCEHCGTSNALRLLGCSGGAAGLVYLCEKDYREHAGGCPECDDRFGHTDDSRIK